MTLQKIQDIAQSYVPLFRGFLAVQCPGHIRHTPNRGDYMGHGMWMCEQIMEMDDRDKAMRWLCFIQGILWCSGLRTIDEMRNDNRG